MKQYLLAAGLLAGLSAQAQVRFSLGPVGSYLASTSSFFSTDYSTVHTTGYRSDFAAGVVADIGLGQFALQPSVQFARRGFTHNSIYSSGYNQSIVRDGVVRLDYVSIPVNFCLTPLSYDQAGQGFQLLFGPYLGILLGGSSRYNVTYTTGAVSTRETPSGEVVVANSYTEPSGNTYYSSRLDFGLQSGVGWRYGGFMLQATYSLGISNVASTPTTPNSFIVDRTQPDRALNRGAQVSLAYLLPIK